MPLDSTKDIARFFAVHSVQVRPEAARALLDQTMKITYTEQRQRYLEKFVQLLKDFQKTRQTSSVLDLETTHTICTS